MVVLGVFDIKLDSNDAFLLLASTLKIQVAQRTIYSGSGESTLVKPQHY
jgi:hypothetical protein